MLQLSDSHFTSIINLFQLNFLFFSFLFSQPNTDQTSLPCFLFIDSYFRLASSRSDRAEFESGLALENLAA
ncbi:hypothetical protein VNO77_29909 [Canavalia gladiata]|uniref:Uncharacterized protein n=1 Tax=Canavalia gladiata TaxID=3824 RepID=A0AAN9KRB5_CANGL